MAWFTMIQPISTTLSTNVRYIGFVRLIHNGKHVCLHSYVLVYRHIYVCTITVGHHCIYTNTLWSFPAFASCVFLVFFVMYTIGIGTIHIYSGPRCTVRYGILYLAR